MVYTYSSLSDAEAAFDAVIGSIEDIIMGEEFQLMQQNFMEEHYLEFEDSEENKLSYTQIFYEYIELLGEQQLAQRIPGFSMSSFILLLKQHKDEVSHDIFYMFLTFTDFVAFKKMFSDYRAEREGRGCDLGQGLVVRSLNSATFNR